MREIVFDTETTGLNPNAGDRVVEIGCVELVNRCQTGESFHVYLNPERAMPPDAFAVHGLSDAFLADKPLFADVADAFLAFAGDAPLVAHNALFDFGFVNAELARIGRPPLASARMVDTREIARRAAPGAKHSLDALCARYGVDRSARVKHGALLDAELLAAVYVEMMGGRQQAFDLVAEADLALRAQAVAVTRVFRTPRPHAASADELAAHAAFLATIKGAIWLSSD